MQVLDYLEYAKISRQAAAEGMVLLKNVDSALPIVAGEKIVLLGRGQFNTVYSGTGSGGLVNPPYQVSINQALSETYDLEYSSQEDYEEFIEANPYQTGLGWAKEPFSQKEMPITSEQMQNYAVDQTHAIYIISRTSGEDKDNRPSPGSYYLDEAEIENLRLARENFSKLTIVLNTGSIIDMSIIEEINPDAILYMWQGGSETGSALADILTGTVNPSGHLVDTIAKNLQAYPSHKNYGGHHENIYEEDIFVGYRYFETFVKEDVLYPFGFGLSYTNFSIEDVVANYQNNKISISSKLLNTGDITGKGVLQVYLEAPQGKLGKATRTLIDFSKSQELNAGDCEIMKFIIPEYLYASYDDSGITGHKTSYVLEAGTYKVYLGFDVRSAEEVLSFEINELKVIETLSEAMSPFKSFNILTTGELDESKGVYTKKEKSVSKRTLPENHYYKNNKKVFIHKLNKKIYFDEYLEGKVTLDEFIDQFSSRELVRMSRGIGMSPKGVRAGVAGAFGGVSKKLASRNIPLVAMADGPSGIRLDDGSMAFQLPIGTALASSFNEELNQKLFEFLGLELKKNNVDSLLGPGMNIHRHPLNGRNFEYFSEDPLLSGRIAKAQVDGMWKYKASGTVKHLVANNQEHRRYNVDTVVSERALREIYLKGFEYLVKNSKLHTIMTAYNPINGIWAASNYELNSKILRDEWGFNGLVVTDWWAKMNWGRKRRGSRRHLGAMIRAQNDIFMVTPSAQYNTFFDSGVWDLRANRISRGELVRNAKNILRVIEKIHHAYHPVKIEVKNDFSRIKEYTHEFELGLIERRKTINLDEYDFKKSTYVLFKFDIEEASKIKLRFKYKSSLLPLAQENIAITANKGIQDFINVRGSKNGSKNMKFKSELKENTIELYFAEGGVEVTSLTITVQ